LYAGARLIGLIDGGRKRILVIAAIALTVLLNGLGRYHALAIVTGVVHSIILSVVLIVLSLCLRRLDHVALTAHGQ